MRVADIAEFRKCLDQYLAVVASGEEVEIRTGGVPLASVVPAWARHRNRTVLGRGVGTVAFKADPAAPMIPSEDWEMVQNDPA
ncbi:MAG: hypothetical protein OXH04_04610 [Acidobacteria bacterium]|nr:hypothetical protein [Acidobacteriota bacterium]